MTDHHPATSSVAYLPHQQPQPQPQPRDPPEPLYCVCRQPFTEGRPMVRCDHCAAWYHAACVGMDPAAFHSSEPWMCPPCAQYGPPSHGPPSHHHHHPYHHPHAMPPPHETM
ncbi:hypothetical protein CXG81DRAFT_8641 [Caulochytrium protostelioides]|uniref:PHD-type domain-containing protein n=1 Tax=Caulochytrium protostelioides TaxID=1555241 RepID=A0A4P9XF20_9FUNG|nr:hypothetical protein CXG81DRAFT_8641 [Caulochytrium protostelioides]|eukprot:RKP04165.1 hypothetical protein CXG81DRAFT_8641 [Caulochytrium protostelioides]